MQCQLELAQVGGQRIAVGTRGALCGLRAEQCIALSTRVDVGDGIAGFHFVAQFHMQGVDAAGDLRAHAYQSRGLQRASGFHHLFDAAANDRRNLQLRRWCGPQPCKQNQRAAQQGGSNHERPAALAWCGAHRRSIQ